MSECRETYFDMGPYTVALHDRPDMLAGKSCDGTISANSEDVIELMHREERVVREQDVANFFDRHGLSTSFSYSPYFIKHQLGENVGRLLEFMSLSPK